MAREVVWPLLAAAGLMLLTPGASFARADETQDALREFGLVGHWAQDCTSAPSHAKADNGRPMNMHLFIEISSTGATAESDIGLVTGRIRSTVVGARELEEGRFELVTHTDSELLEQTTTTVFAKRAGKLAVWSGRTEGLGNRDAPTYPAGPIAQDVPFEFEAVRDGELLSRGEAVGPAPVIEKCAPNQIESTH